jgi:acetate kinase
MNDRSTARTQPILVINSGSSSLKASLFVPGDGLNGDERPVLEAAATGIGQTEGRLSIKDADGHALSPNSSSGKHNYQPSTPIKRLSRLDTAWFTAACT